MRLTLGAHALRPTPPRTTPHTRHVSIPARSVPRVHRQAVVVTTNVTKQELASGRLYRPNASVLRNIEPYSLLSKAAMSTMIKMLVCKIIPKGGLIGGGCLTVLIWHAGNWCGFDLDCIVWLNVHAIVHWYTHRHSGINQG